MPEKKITNKIKKENIPEYGKEKLCSYFFSQSAFNIEKVATHSKEQNKKKSCQLVEEQKTYLKS